MAYDQQTADALRELDELREERDKLRTALTYLVAWIDGYRPESGRRRVLFTETNPELTFAREALALAEEGRDA